MKLIRPYCASNPKLQMPSCKHEVLDEKGIYLIFELGVLSRKSGDARDLQREIICWEWRFSLTKEDIKFLSKDIELMETRINALMKVRAAICSRFVRPSVDEEEMVNVLGIKLIENVILSGSVKIQLAKAIVAHLNNTKGGET